MKEDFAFQVINFNAIYQNKTKVVIKKVNVRGLQEG